MILTYYRERQTEREREKLETNAGVQYLGTYIYTS